MASEHEIRAGAKVIGGHGRTLGIVESVRHDPDSGAVSGFVIKHGFWFLSRQKLVSPDVIRQVNNNPDTIVVNLQKRELRRLPEVESA